MVNVYCYRHLNKNINCDDNDTNCKKTVAFKFRNYFQAVLN